MSQCPPDYDGPIWVDCKHETEYEKMTRSCDICGAAVCCQCRVCEMCKVFEELGAVNYLGFEARSDERLKAENAANIEQLSLLADLFAYDDTVGGESLVDYISRMVGKLRNENRALRDALRVRINTAKDGVCPECWKQLQYWKHSVACRHYKTEQKVTQQG